MRIALLGYGKMGKLVEQIALREGWEVGPRLDIGDNVQGSGITRTSMSGVDVAVDFSQPDAVIANIEAASRAGVTIVVGTTGWLNDRARIQRRVEQTAIGLVYGSNFSIGMNLFFTIVSHAAQVIAKIPQYEAFLEEQHHRAKKDAPSGTALTLAELMRPYFKNQEPGISSVRAGYIPGNHIVGFDSEADTILLEHRARSRQGFAEGAILAARWIAGKKGFYEFHDVFREILGISSEKL